MVFVPPPPPASRRAQELGRRLGDQIDAYRKEHPDLSDMEIRQALRLARRGCANRPLALVIAAGVVAIAGVLTAVSQKSGTAGSGVPKGASTLIPAVFVVTLVLVALWVFLRRLR